MRRLLKWATTLALAVGVFGVPTVVRAATIDVLWYTGGVISNDFHYRAHVYELAALAPGAPGGNTWNVTFWEPGAPPIGSFDALVVASPQGPWYTSPDYTSLNANQPTLGDRVMVTGQDADFHFMELPGPADFDGPQGFLLDAVNWAASGTGLGAVFLGDVGEAQAFGLTGFTYQGGETNDVTIPPAFAAFPINTGLTTGGLSFWGISAHDTYLVDTTLWTSINTNGTCDPGVDDNCTVTFVSASTGGGGITTPEPGTLTLLGLGLVGLVRTRRRRA